MTMLITNKNNKESIFNNQFVFILVNYNTLLETPASERKATGLALRPKYATKVIKVGFQNIRMGAHTRTQVKFSLTTPQRDTGQQTYNSSHFSPLHLGGDEWSTSRLPPPEGHMHVYIHRMFTNEWCSFKS